MIQPISFYSPNYNKKSNKTPIVFEAKENEAKPSKKMTVIGVLSMLAFWGVVEFFVDKIEDIKSEKEVDKMMAPLTKDLNPDGLEDILKNGAKKASKVVK